MLNPNEQFVVVSLMRSQIASCFNDVIQDQQLTTRPFTDDDDRLTSDVCREAAAAWADVLDDDLSEEDRGPAQRDEMYAIIQKHFIS
mgnify:CR=1 FL=1